MTGLLAVAGATSASAATAPGVTAIAPSPEGAPDGCVPGDFCSYNEGNGGDLCWSTTSSYANLPAACADENDSAYNYGATAYNLYYYTGETGAYYTLGAESYLLSMSTNYFNHCPGGGTACAGYGDPVGYNVESIGIS
jgi:hypothetical protein